MSDIEQDLAAGFVIALAEHAKKQAEVKALMAVGSGQSMLPLFGDVPEMFVIDGDAEDAARGPGRPKGAKNKRAQDFADYILGQCGSPLMVLGKTYSRPVEALAKQLKCSLEKAFAFQQAAALGLAPYLHQRLPQAIEVELEKALPGLVIGITKAYSENADHTTVEIPVLEVIKPD